MQWGSTSRLKKKKKKSIIQWHAHAKQAQIYMAGGVNIKPTTNVYRKASPSALTCSSPVILCSLLLYSAGVESHRDQSRLLQGYNLWSKCVSARARGRKMGFSLINCRWWCAHMLWRTGDVQGLVMCVSSYATTSEGPEVPRDFQDPVL